MHLTLGNTRRLRGALLAAGALAALAALPSVAVATTFCVDLDAADCVARGGQKSESIQTALDEAKSLAGPDTVLIGATKFPHEGPFVYQPVGENPVTIEGAGSSRPVISIDSPKTALTLDQATVRGIDVSMSPGATGTGIEIGRGALEDVTVSSRGQGSGTGIRVTGETSIIRSRVTAAGDVGVAVVGSQAEMNGGFVDVRNAVFGIFAAGGDIKLATSRVSARLTALQADGTGLGDTVSAVITRSTFVSTIANSVGVAAIDANLVLQHVTIARQGASDPLDAGVLLIGRGRNGQAFLQSVAVSGYARGIMRKVNAGRSFPTFVGDSVWDAAGDLRGGASAGEFIESRTTHADPGLVDPATGDLRPRAGSPAIDRDQILDPSAYFDLDELPAVDGDGDGSVLPDAGALEFRPPLPPGVPEVPSGGGDSPPVPSTPPAPGGDRRAPGLSKVRVSTKRVRVRRAKTLRLRFTLDERATLRIVAKRKVRGRKVAAGAAVVLRARAGRGDVALAKTLKRLKVLRPGSVTLVVTATDAAGNRSTPRSVRLELRA